MHGGEIVAEGLKQQGVPYLLTLCGGHISPILVGCQGRGIRVVDTRHEATAVFAADAIARLSGRPGVAAVTAGPGLTNSLTALKNAHLAQSPVVLIAGAAPTALRGRGALQDIDQMALVRPIVKWARRVSRVADLAPSLARAFAEAQTGVPGPVCLEIPVDVLYPEPLVRELYGLGRGGRGLSGWAVQRYLRWHVDRMFAGGSTPPAAANAPAQVPVLAPNRAVVKRAAEHLIRAERPVLLVGSQALMQVGQAARVARAVEQLGVPAYLSGMARGLLGGNHPLQYRHKRREALREADCVVLAGVPFDFRLDYGRHISRAAVVIAANLSRTEMRRNRRPAIEVLADAGEFLQMLAHVAPAPAGRWAEWRGTLDAREAGREAEIEQQALAPVGKINPLYLCQEIEASLPPEAIVVADGGDFVATAAYIVRPRGPLKWLDPGVFGTLGVGAGFALGAKLVHPDAQVVILYGDGAAGYSLIELDTFARHGLGVVAVVGNDAGWTQIAREQVPMLGDPVGTALALTAYDRAAEGFGAVGLSVSDPEAVPEALAQALGVAAGGRPVLVNAHLGRTDFRRGSVSM